MLVFVPLFLFCRVVVLQLSAEFVFQLFDAGKSGFDVFRQRLSEFVVGDTYWLVYVAQGVFSHDLVFVLAKQQADSRIISLPAKGIVYSRTIEIQLSDIFGLEFSSFELDDQISVHESMGVLNWMFLIWQQPVAKL